MISVALTDDALAKEKSQARRAGVASVALLVVLFLLPFTLFTGFVAFAFAVTTWQFVFHGSTAVSMCLKGGRRKLFQIAVAITFPLALSWDFAKDAPSLTASGIFGQMATPWLLFPVALIGHVSWRMAKDLDQEHPFRGFLIASAVIFIVCLFGYHGLHTEYDDYSETANMSLDKEAALEAAQSGRFFGQFLLYVVVSYAAMLARLWKRHA
ncbi:MAG: hypothetical protein ABL878_05215 [Burkholderiales bacterium]